MPSRSSPPEPGASERLSTLEALFHRALELPPEQRLAWVDERLADDPGQARLLRKMLDLAETDASGVTGAIGEIARESVGPRDRAGERIDRYRLISRIRYGGMAEVYRAARDDGQFDHEVALKVIRSDRVRPELNELFAVERALMARLKHPHIIQIFDGGATPQGEAYYVMELLDGLPLPAAITRYELDSRAVLGHLYELCLALNHIHGQLIVHRDIKPENVLLCRTPEGLSVKLLDFGIAAQLSAGIRPGDGAELASPAGVWHSPGYAAPETLGGQADNAAADIYSLGRLILDCVPLVLPRYREELRAIGEQAGHGTPERRYAGAVAVAEDLDRVRRREPISLFRHRRLHVLQRAIQRHRWVVAAAVVLTLAGSVWLWRESALRIEAEQATARAAVERDRAEAMRDFLLDAFDSSNPRLNRGEEPRVSDLIIDQLDLLEDAEQLDPEARYELLSTFGDLLLNLDRRELADRAITRATELMESLGREGDLRWISTITQRGKIASRDGRFDEAAALFEQAESAINRLPPSVDRARQAWMLYNSWGINEHQRGQLDKAEQLVRRGLESQDILRSAGDPAGDEAAMRMLLGAIQYARGNVQGANEIFERAYKDHRAVGHDQTFEHLDLLGWLGITFDNLGQAVSAESYLVEAVELAEKLFPEPTTKLSATFNNLGRFYINQGQLAEAEPLLRKALEASVATGDADTPSHASRLYNLGLLAFEVEQLDEAIDLWQQAHALWEDTLGSAHPNTLTLQLRLALVRAEAGRSPPTLTEAEALVDAFEPGLLRAGALLLAARLAAENGGPNEAEAALEAALAIMNSSESATPDMAGLYWLEGRARQALSQPEAARTAFLSAAASYHELDRKKYPARGRALLHAALLTPAGDPERGRLGEEARAILVQHLQPPAESLRLLESL